MNRSIPAIYKFSLILLIAFALRLPITAALPEPFQSGTQAYLAGNFPQAATLYRQSADASLAPGTLHNLGNAEWKSGRPGPAILAWEQAYWINPSSVNTRANLRFARHSAQLESPSLSWFEICSTWLPVNAWLFVASLSLWLAVAMMLLPGIFRWKKSDWHQGLAAGGFAIFLVTVPALLGVHSRSKLGVLLPKQTALRLTPTKDAQTLGQLPAGEVARLERERGDYVYVRAANDAAGWVERAQFGLISGK
jgi:tetratricopeptide (TPR) repeat protein